MSVQESPAVRPSHFLVVPGWYSRLRAFLQRARCAAFAVPQGTRFSSSQQLPCLENLSFLQQQNQACLDQFHCRVGNGKTSLNICGCGPGVWLLELGLVAAWPGLWSSISAVWVQERLH